MSRLFTENTVDWRVDKQSCYLKRLSIVINDPLYASGRHVALICMMIGSRQYNDSYPIQIYESFENHYLILKSFDVIYLDVPPSISV